MTLRNSSDLAKVAFQLTDNRVFEKDPHLAYVMRLWMLYFAAQETAKKYGYIGVGCISFAEWRLVEAQRKLSVKLAKRKKDLNYGS